MKQPVELIPLKCTRCSTPVPAEPDEVVWICETCKQGLQLDEEVGLTPLEIHFAKPVSNTDLRWLPFWVSKGRVFLRHRENYSGGDLSNLIWKGDHTFIIPAFSCTLEQAVRWGMRNLRNPIQLRDGLQGEFSKVTVGKVDAGALAEFIVITIEAERDDKIKNLEFELVLKEMVLWIIPFGVEDAILYFGDAQGKI